MYTHTYMYICIHIHTNTHTHTHTDYGLAIITYSQTVPAPLVERAEAQHLAGLHGELQGPLHLRLALAVARHLNFASQDFDICLHNVCGSFAENRGDCHVPM